MWTIHFTYSIQVWNEHMCVCEELETVHVYSVHIQHKHTWIWGYWYTACKWSISHQWPRATNERARAKKYARKDAVSMLNVIMSATPWKWECLALIIHAHAVTRQLQLIHENTSAVRKKKKCEHNQRHNRREIVHCQRTVCSTPFNSPLSRQRILDCFRDFYVPLELSNIMLSILWPQIFLQGFLKPKNPPGPLAPGRRACV